MTLPHFHFRSHWILFLWILILAVLGCKKNREEQILFLPCDHFNKQGECLEPRSNPHTYKVRVPQMRKLHTWEDLANYLYFYARETPGFLLLFPLDTSPEEMEGIRQCFQAKIKFHKTTEIMEGKEFGNHWVGSFQYLGSILKEELRRRNDLKDEIRLNQIFPAEMEFQIEYEYQKKKVQRTETFTIDLVLE